MPGTRDHYFSWGVGMNTLFKVLMFAAVTVLPALSWGHAQLLVAPSPEDANPAAFNSPLPREDSVRMKDILPCGGLRGDPPVSIKGPPKRTYTRGATIRVHWKETNDHAGIWRFDISADNEKTWKLLLNLKDATDEDSGTVTLSEETPKYYWADLVLPAELQCENCTFRMTQSMGGIDDDNDYFSCADIRIQ